MPQRKELPKGGIAGGLVREFCLCIGSGAEWGRSFHKEWCNLIFLAGRREKGLVFRATIEPDS